MRVTNATPAVGAYVSALDVRDLSSRQGAELRAHLVERKVLVLRHPPITSRDYVEFIGAFGEVVQDDLVPHEGHPEELCLLHIRPQEKQTINFWHMDYSFKTHPTPILSLCAQQIPPCGGDTLFANLEAAYDGLPDETKARIDGLETNHKITETQNAAKRFTADEFRSMVEGEPVRHPLVCLNPDNGRKFLFVNVPIYCRSIVGMDNAEGDALLTFLYQHVQRPEFHFRLVWEPNTIVVWENTHCLHYPVSDYFPHERLMWRLATRATARPLAA